MKYIVYLTTNLINKKIYIGVHQTEDPDVFDGYIGCGVNIYSPSSYKKSRTAFQYAVNKYGKNNFTRYTLKVFDTEEEAYKFEEFIVDSEFIKRQDVYNTFLGGNKGPDQSVLVYQYSLDGNFIKEWSSYKDAAIEMNCSPTSIENAVNFLYSSCEYYWSRQKVEKLDLTNFSKQKRNSCIYEYLSTGEYNKTYRSVSDIMDVYKVNRASINKAIQSKSLCKNHYFSLEKVEVYKPEQVNINTKNKKIYLYDQNGKFFKEFDSPKACSDFFGLKRINLATIIRLNRLVQGYQVSLEKVESMKVFTPNTRIRIAQYSLNGELIKIWDSLAQAKKEFGSGVEKNIKGQIQQYKNYIFKKVKDMV